MWGETLNENILFKAATAAPQMEPGQISRFGNGVIARYIQGAAALDNDTLAAGEPALLLAPLTAWNDGAYHDPVTTTNVVGMKMYVATNDYGATGAANGGVIGPPLLAGFAVVAIPETYWGWALVEGYMSYARCYEAATTQYGYLKLDVAITTALGLGVELCTDDTFAIGYSWAADDGTAHTVAGYFNANGLGHIMDIA